MSRQTHPVLVPYRMREAVIAGDGFVQQMRVRGYSVADFRPVYSDPAVIRQPWLVCPNGAKYSDRAFYDLFGVTSFRKLLRTALQSTPCSTDALITCCPDILEREHYLAFLQDQQLLRFEGKYWQRGVRLFQITDIGHSLEWYIAQWFRLNKSPTRLAPVRHGVRLYRLLDDADMDVIALLEPETVFVECKSSSTVSDQELSLFFQRIRSLVPDVAILLLDWASQVLQGRIRRLNAILASHHEQELLTPVPAMQGVYWGAKCLYVTGVDQSLSLALGRVSQVYEQRLRQL